MPFCGRDEEMVCVASVLLLSLEWDPPWGKGMSWVIRLLMDDDGISMTMEQNLCPYGLPRCADSF
jgi:hypothetical protein